MKSLTYTLLAIICASLVGCGTKPPPAPPMTDSLRAAIAEEDSRIQAEESRR